MTLLQENKNPVSSRAQSRDLAPSILKTLTYSDHFSFPLTCDEIYMRLVGADPCVRPVLIHHLNHMIKSGGIQKTGAYYHLHSHSEFISLRQKRAEISLIKLTHAQKIADILAKCPTVLAIFVTGSLAVKNANKRDDIDFMIIAKNHRLWLTRLYMTGITELLGARRHPLAKHIKDKVCLNLYLTPNSFSLHDSKRSLYTAYELIQAVPLYDPHNTHAQLLAANAWISNYLPNFPLPVAPRSDLVGHPKRSDLTGIIESLAYKLQIWYMRKKITNEYITPEAAFFHPHNPGVPILKKLDELK